MRVSLKIIVATALMGTSVHAIAHHSFAMFDDKKDVSLVGEIQDFQWTNPHSWIFLITTDASGKTSDWKIEGGSPNLLRRNGWTRKSLAPGDKVTVVIHPAKNGTAFGSVVSVLRADGSKIGTR